VSSFTLPAPAKLNLFLHITGQRDDGYHTLQTVFQLLNQGDTLTYTLNDSKQINFSCNNPSLEGPHNLVMQAATSLLEKTGISQGTDITSTKYCPKVADWAEVALMLPQPCWHSTGSGTASLRPMNWLN